MQQAMSDIAIKYQGVAPRQVIAAVAAAAKRTGADFAYLMEKASAESSFDPKAGSRTSSAKGLFQFIESTWLSMVKQYGPKYGLGQYASRITLKDGRPCVDDCEVKKQILNLRSDPRLSALMAGEYSAENQAYLEKNTKGDVGATELYFAHFMGANGAAKFLNCRACNGDAVAADVFPSAANANKNVFFDPATGKARSFDEIYAVFANKFGVTCDDSSSDNKINSGFSLPPMENDGAPSDASSAAAPVAPLKAPDVQEVLQQALPLFDDNNESDDIIWNDDARFYPAHRPSRGISPGMFMTLLEMTQMPGSFTGRKDDQGYNA
jgi:hypothetical protein